VDAIPEITNSRKDVTIHKTATPKTSLLSRAACRSLILFSLCMSMSICIDAHILVSVYTCRVKKKNYGQQLPKNTQSTWRTEFAKKLPASLNHEIYQGVTVMLSAAE
jgi:hypothetical protein